METKFLQYPKRPASKLKTTTKNEVDSNKLLNLTFYFFNY